MTNTELNDLFLRYEELYHLCGKTEDGKIEVYLDWEFNKFQIAEKDGYVIKEWRFGNFKGELSLISDYLDSLIEKYNVCFINSKEDVVKEIRERWLKSGISIIGDEEVKEEIVLTNRQMEIKGYSQFEVVNESYWGPNKDFLVVIGENGGDVSTTRIYRNGSVA